LRNMRENLLLLLMLHHSLHLCIELSSLWVLMLLVRLDELRMLLLLLIQLLKVLTRLGRMSV
jgi:hypothetical protein